MITSPVSHDHTLVDQLNSVTVTQPAVTRTNESNIENKICNIKTKVSHLIGNIPNYFSKGIKAAGKYTYETVNTYPKIAILTLTLSLLLFIALTICSYIVYDQASHPIIAASTLTSGLAAALIIPVILVSFIAFGYKTSTNQEKRDSIIQHACAITVIVTLALALVAASAYSYKIGSH